MTERAESPNISFFAFTATPKAKTLELFGRTRAPTGKPQPFHLYTMQQAIEEGFILDVLRGYHTYKHGVPGSPAERPRAATGRRGGDAVPTAHQGADALGEAAPDEHRARRCRSSSSTSARTSPHLLDGQAKAMVVTDSRKAAVRYKLAIDEYIAKQGYADIGTLVAFSGDGDATTSDGGPGDDVHRGAR